MPELYKDKILIVEDDAHMSDFLKLLLETEGYAVLTAGSCEEGRILFSSHRPELVILDLGLPDRDGTSLIAYIRERTAMPVVVLSARTEENDKIDALDLGANDYITKPFSTGELLARIRSAIRGARITGITGGERTAGMRYSAGGLVIDYGKRLVTLNGSEIHMTRTEYCILETLSRHSGKIMTYSAIVRDVWGEEETGSIKKLQVNMANIRKKLGSEPGRSQIIENLLGVGYRME